MKNKKRGFSLVGLLVLLAVAAVAIVLTASVMTRRHVTKGDEIILGKHGLYVCYLDGVTQRAVLRIEGGAPVQEESCNPKDHIPKMAKDFTITLIGGGGAGAQTDVPFIDEHSSPTEKSFIINDSIQPGVVYNIDFNPPYTQDNDILEEYNKFINNIHVKNLMVSGGGGANAVLTGLGGGDVGKLLGGIFPSVVPSGVNHCRCTNEYDGNIETAPNGEHDVDDVDLNKSLNLETIITWITSGAFQKKEGWNWNQYPACSSPQCTNGSGSLRYCRAINKHDATYDVAARGGDGGVCELALYTPKPGDVLYYKAGRGGVYSSSFAAIDIKDRFKKIGSYSSRGDDGFIKILSNGREIGSLTAKGGDAPQYRRVESATWIGSNTYGNCPVHASVKSCGSSYVGDKKIGLTAYKCEAKENRGAGTCIAQGLTNSFAGNGSSFKFQEAIFGGGGKGALGYNSKNGVITDDAETKALRQDGNPGSYGVEMLYVEGNVPDDGKNTKIYAKAYRTKITLKQGQAGSEGLVYIFKTRRLPDSNIIIGRGGVIGTDADGKSTSYGGYTANGGDRGIVQEAELIDNGQITLRKYDGQNGSANYRGIPEAIYLSLFDKSAQRSMTNAAGDNKSTYFGGSGSSNGWTMKVNGTSVDSQTIKNTGSRLHYSYAGTIESDSKDDACNSTNKYSGNCPNPAKSDVTFETYGSVGNGGDGAVIITW